ncbi:MAG: hypothetical protein AAFR55_07270, partial [Pseudomonadota bacterium]
MAQRKRADGLLEELLAMALTVNRRRTRARRLATALGIVGASCVALAAAAFPVDDARAYDLRQTVMPASDAALGPPIWQGFYARPDIGWDTYDFTGAGATGFDDITGWSLGGQLGYDHQFGRFLLGIQAEGAFADMDERGGAARTLRTHTRGIGPRPRFCHVIFTGQRVRMALRHGNFP